MNGGKPLSTPTTVHEARRERYASIQKDRLLELMEFLLDPNEDFTCQVFVDIKPSDLRWHIEKGHLQNSPTAKEVRAALMERKGNR